MNDFLFRFCPNKIIKIKESGFFFFSFTIGGFNSDLFVILFKGSQIFSGFREFTFFHTFSDIPMNKGSLSVHKIELMIKSREYFGDCSGVGNHADGSHDFGQISSGDYSWRLIVDTDFESGRAPIDKLNGSLSLDGGDRSINVFWDDITSVKH